MPSSPLTITDRKPPRPVLVRAWDKEAGTVCWLYGESVDCMPVHETQLVDYSNTIPVSVAKRVVFTETAEVRVSQYAEGVMSRVVSYRQEIGQLPRYLYEYDGAVAARNCADIGETVYLRHNEEWESFIIADCASKTDRQSPLDPRSGYEWMLDGGIWYEVDFRTAARWGAVGMMTTAETVVDTHTVIVE